MSTNPNPAVLNAVNMTPELSAAVSAAVSPEAIKAAILAEAEKQTGATNDAAQVETARVAAEAKAKEAAETKPKSFSRTETIGGREFVFEGESELEIANMAANAFKVAYAVQPAEAVPAVAATPAVPQKTEEEKAAERAELELQFKRGEMDTATYLERSGAVDAYLASKGIPVDALKATVETNQKNQFEKSWSDATQEFLRTTAGADWPGGDRNLALIGDKLAAMNLIDSADKVAALAQAWGEMKTKKTYFAADETPAAVAAPAVAAPVVPAAAAVVPAVPATATPVPARTTSSLFGASSGTSGGAAVTPTANATAKLDIPADATPAEILDAWKKGQLAQGVDPNAAFVQTFAAKRG